MVTKKYITEAIDSLATYSGQIVNFGNAEDVHSAIAKILSFQTMEFWLTDWTISVSDTSSARPSGRCAEVSSAEFARQGTVEP